MISFVYFDVGGVVINDFSGNDKWDQMMGELGVVNEQRHEFQEILKGYLRQIHVGMDVNAVVPVLNERLGLSLPEGSDLLHAFVKRFGKNESIWPVIAEAQKIAKAGLLTNMYPRMLDACFVAEIMPDVAWDVIVDSTVVKMQKPDHEIFAYAEQQAGVPADQILFVENTEVNIESAKQCGWQTFLYSPADELASSAALRERLNRG